MTGKAEIGIRPEFVRLTDDAAGLPVTVKTVDDIGRYRILRGSLGASTQRHRAGGPVDPGRAARTFDPGRLNVYAGAHLVEPAIARS
ncbi:hypothetical protein A6302_03650 [Methylobrevis pamukkalensis]|uniref:Uncharacterized protein n=1 Tax=Methylobrevis pamukkalensis TaxID=1439726 RepID=A0A1E3GYF0_9HYPH|nr:hypothetical protein A6302_03650 [Methylobrevis pamukkalensis]